LGHGVIVLPGVTIGRNVVVGAGSVVARDLPDHCVAVGSPARPVRRYDPDQGWLDVDGAGHEQPSGNGIAGLANQLAEPVRADTDDLGPAAAGLR
jgi:carbonic anhydrase/acetyltransferase-like protein (isoleucine patch superfamily)